MATLRWWESRRIVHDTLTGDVLAWQGGTLRVAPAGSSPAAGDTAIVVRPERLRLRLASESPGEEENAVSGVLREVIYLGSSRRYVVDLEEMVAQARVQVGEASVPVEPGDRVLVSWRIEDGVLVSAVEALAQDAEAEVAAIGSPAATLRVS